MDSLFLLAAGGGDILAQVVTTVITFLLVMFTLKAFAWKPILDLLEERRNQISTKFDEIDKKAADANALVKDYEERIRRIDDEARERQNKAIDEGRRMAQELIEKARHDAEEITEKARQNMAMEIEKARLQLRQEAVEMTLVASGKLLKTSLDDSRHRDLVSGFISELENRKAS